MINLTDAHKLIHMYRNQAIHSKKDLSGNGSDETKSEACLFYKIFKDKAWMMHIFTKYNNYICNNINTLISIWCEPISE